MHNRKSALENEKHKLLWNFEIQTDHEISARWSNLIIVNNKKEKTCWKVNFAVLSDLRIKLKEIKKKYKYLDLAKELKKK